MRLWLGGRNKTKQRLSDNVVRPETDPKRMNRQGPHMSVSVDGVAELNWTDTGPGAPLPGGFVGLRHMSDMGNGVYTHLEVQVTA